MIIRLYISIILAGLLVVFWTPGLHARQWDGGPVVIEDLVFQVPDSHADEFDWPELARALVGLEPGDELSAAVLERAVGALESLTRVQTAVSLTDQGAVVTFTLHPYKRIKSIAVEGSYPLFESDVLKLMTVAQGDIFKPEVILAQADPIAQRYRNEGYIDPQVKMSWKQDKSDGHYHVRVTIEKGPAYYLHRVKITGNHNISDVVLMGLMRTWRRPGVWIGKGRFVEADLKEDINKLIAHYRARGYADVQIEDTVSYDRAGRQVEVRITIDEGPQYSVVFIGNDFFSDNTLRRDMEIFTRGNRGNTGLRRSVLNIRRRYLEAGFADVRVVRSDTPADQDSSGQVIVRIEIEEGLRHIVEQVIIEGNRGIDADQIREQMLTRPPGRLRKGIYVASVLQEDSAAVRVLYQKNGYLDARVTAKAVVDEQTRKVVVTLTIDEGVQALVGDVTVKGQDLVAVDQLLPLIKLKEGDPFLPFRVPDDEDALASRIAELGYPHVQVRGEVTFSEDLSRADIAFQIDPGPFVQVGKIFWAGNFRTRQSLLNRDLKLKTGDPFSLAAVLAAQRRLRDLDLFRSVQVRTIGLKEKAPKVHLLVTMAEAPSYFFELGGGYQTDKAFYGRTRVGDHNFLGTGKTVWLGGEQSGIGYRLEAGATEPHLLGSQVSAELELYKERREEFNQDFGVESVGSKLTFSRSLGRKVTTSLGLRYERRLQYLRGNDASSSDVDPATLEPRSFVVTTPAIQWDTRDSFIHPHKGGLAGLAVDISKSLEGRSDDFIKYQLDLRGYRNPFDKLVFAGRFFAGYLQPNSAEGLIPKDQLFFLGGTSDVRGFAENKLLFNEDQKPVGGRLALVGSLEARYNLVGNWELTLFVDAGNLQETLDSPINNGWRWSAGLGLRYDTPIGPIGLLYGHKLNPRPGESSGQYHISIGYTF